MASRSWLAASMLRSISASLPYLIWAAFSQSPARVARSSSARACSSSSLSCCTRVMELFSRVQRSLRPADSPRRRSSSSSMWRRRSFDAVSFSRFSAWRSISRCETRRSMLSISIGMLPIWILQRGAGFVDQIDGLVGQETVGDVAVREHGRGHDGGILDAHAVVDLELLFEAAQNGDGVVDRRFADQTVWKRRARAASFSTYLRYSVSVVAPMQRSSPRASAGFSMLAASIAPSAPPAPTSVCSSSMKQMISPFDSVISLRTALRRSSNSPRNLVPATIWPRSIATSFLLRKLVGHVAFEDALREAFDDGRLADAGLADEHRIVLGAPAEHLHDAADFVVAADHRDRACRGGPAR